MVSNASHCSAGTRSLAVHPGTFLYNQESSWEMQRLPAILCEFRFGATQRLSLLLQGFGMLPACCWLLRSEAWDASISPLSLLCPQDLGLGRWPDAGGRCSCKSPSSTSAAIAAAAPAALSLSTKRYCHGRVKKTRAYLQRASEATAWTAREVLALSRAPAAHSFFLPGSHFSSLVGVPQSLSFGFIFT